MSLLFVLAGDEQALGRTAELTRPEHRALLQLAKSAPGPFPLVRRLSEYYRDAGYEPDEIQAFKMELEELNQRNMSLDTLVDFAKLAIREDTGIEAISD